MINRTKVKESTQIKPGDNGDVLVMKDNAPEWSTPSDADLAKASDTDAKLAEKQDKLVAGDNIHIVGNTISADGKPTPIAIGTVTSGEVPMVSNSGTDTDVVLNFVLPKGDKGDKGDQGLQGPQGPVGAPFQVKKIYDSVEAMNADYSGSDVAVGEFVLIDTGDVQDPDNSKLYVKGTTQYDFVTDLSGAQGIQGPQGTPGTPAGFGNITATVDSTTGTPQVSVQSDGPNTAKNISFSFTGLKGEKGDPGESGTQINNLAPLVVGRVPTAGDTTSVAIGPDASASADGYVAIGDRARASGAVTGGYGSVAVGPSASAKDRGVAVGNTATSDAFSVAIGYNARTGGNTQSVVIGHQSTAAASCYHPAAVGSDIEINDSNAAAIGYHASIETGGENSVSLGSYSTTAEPNVVSVGSGDAAMALTDDMDEETKARIQAREATATRRIVNVTDPQNAQDAATKNYVDTEIAKVPVVNSVAPLMVDTAPVANSDSIAIGNNVHTAYVRPTLDDKGVYIGNNIIMRDNETDNVVIGELSDRTSTDKPLMTKSVIIGLDNDVSRMNYGGSALGPTTIVGGNNEFLDGWGSGPNEQISGFGAPNTARATSVLGNNNTSYGGYSTIVGSFNTSELDCSVAIGYNAAVANNMPAGDRSVHAGGIAIGSGSRADNYSVAIGPNYANEETTTFDDDDLPSGYTGSNFGVAIGTRAHSLSNYGLAIGASSSVASAAGYAAAIGAMSSATEPYTVSVGSGDAAMALTDDMDEETKARIQARAAATTRRIVNVTDPRDAQDAATKNYVDTQLEPINAKLQYVPENTNQILSQIQTNVEKAQAAADAKVASITAGTGISVDASNPTAPVVSTTGLATQASVDTLTTTVNSKADQADLDSLEGTVAGKADTSALANYATKTELAAKADQTTVDAKVSSVTAGTGVSITGSATAPVVNGMIAVPDWANPVSLSPSNYGGGVYFDVNPVPNTGVISFKMAQRGSISINDTSVYNWAMTQDGQQCIFPVAAGDNLSVSFDLGGAPSTIKLFPYKFVEIS